MNDPFVALIVGLLVMAYVKFGEITSPFDAQWSPLYCRFVVTTYVLLWPLLWPIAIFRRLKK